MKISFSSFFAPIQHCLSSSCGSEGVVHHIQAFLDKNKDWVLLKTDVKNAFNSIDHLAIANRLSSSLPSIMPHFCQMYGRPSSLVFSSPTGATLLSSEEGVHQGDRLGLALFATGIHQSLVEIPNRPPNVVVLAYLDGVFVLSPGQNVQQAFDDLKTSFGKLSLTVADHKCDQSRLLPQRRSLATRLEPPSSGALLAPPSTSSKRVFRKRKKATSYAECYQVLMIRSALFCSFGIATLLDSIIWAYPSLHIFCAQQLIFTMDSQR